MNDARQDPPERTFGSIDPSRLPPRADIMDDIIEQVPDQPPAGEGRA